MMANIVECLVYTSTILSPLHMHMESFNPPETL